MKSLPLRKKKTTQNPEEGGVEDIHFTSDENLITAGESGVRHWNLQDGSSKSLIRNKLWTGMVVSKDNRFVLTREDGAVPIMLDRS